MEYSEDTEHLQYNYNNIQKLLKAELEKSPERFSKPISVLPDIDDNVECQLEQELLNESKCNIGNRIILIPYRLENSHWIGILIELQAAKQIQRAEYIDPVNRSSFIPDRLQKQLAKVYPFAVLQTKNLLKHDDRTHSAKLTIKNLLAAVESYQRPEMRQPYVNISDGNETSTYSAESKSLDGQQSKNTISKESNDYRLADLGQQLKNGLEKLKIPDVSLISQKIQEIEVRIKEYDDEGRIDDIEKEEKYLRELQELQKISELIYPESISSIPHKDNESNVNRAVKQGLASSSNIIALEKNKRLLHLNELREDFAAMPPCAEKTILELLEHFQQKLLEDYPYSQQQNSVIEMLGKLNDQIKKQDLLSKEIQTSLQNLTIAVNSRNDSSSVNILHQLQKEIKPLNVQEIKRLVSKAKTAAELIRDKDILLLVGETGSGKSTTIQFLAGSEMKEVQVEIEPGKFLDHITPIGPVKNPELNNVTSSPFHKSETRYITPVTIPLKDILGSHETDIITLCDAPGFSDTAGVEVDIANSVGVIEALKGTKSVKILALSSYQSLGDRGEGIQRLAHILINMMHKIDDRLDAIIYAFTKYPEKKNINAVLTDIKNQKVNKDRFLRSDTAFVTVLSDMIDKTEGDTYKIDPIHGDRKRLIKKLKRTKGIQHPEEVFQFSIGRETRTSISNHVEKDKSSIICAMKYKNNELVIYYLNDLKTLHNLTKQNFVQVAYESSIRWISEYINKYCMEIMRKFNRVLGSRDRLREDDIHEYKAAVEYLQIIQILKEHLGSFLLSPETLMQNIISKLNERRWALNKEDLYNPLVGVHLNNIRMLKNSFKELEIYYHRSCKEFDKRFYLLVQSARELILTNNFKEIAEIILRIYKSSRVLKDHLDEKVEETYCNIVKSLLQHLSSFSERSDPLLQKTRLTNDDIEILKSYIEILRSAKECSPLQDRILTYIDMLKGRIAVSNQYNTNWTSEEIFTDLTEIYNNFIMKIVNYFNEINGRIEELFKTSKDHALEDIQNFIDDMDAIRKIPGVEYKTAGTYNSTVKNIEIYMHRLQIEAEQLLFAIDNQAVTISYKSLAQSLLRLKNAEWINRVSPGTCDTLMRRIKEKLVQHACQLEDRLMNIDYSLKCPDNVSIVQEIVKKIESMRDLESSVPELEKHRQSVLQRFLQCTQTAFDCIQTTFNLQDKDVYLIKQELKNLEETKNECNDLHPARIFLRKHHYSDIIILNGEIEELKTRQKDARQVAETEQRDMKHTLENLNSIVREYMNLYPSETDQGVAEELSGMLGDALHGKSTQAERYLKTVGYSSIDVVREKIAETEKSYCNKLQWSTKQNEELSISLSHLELIKEEHDSLLATRNLVSSEEISFLREKGFNSYELLDENIQEKTRIIGERGQNKQSFHFSDRIDTSTANNALVYLSQCEKVGHHCVKENAADTHEILKNYLSEYGNFLNQEITKTFNYIISIDAEGGRFQHSQDLEMRLQELSSLNRFPHVFECIDGFAKVEHWRREFLKYHRDLDDKMKACEDDKRYRDSSGTTDRLEEAQRSLALYEPPRKLFKAAVENQQSSIIENLGELSPLEPKLLPLPLYRELNDYLTIVHALSCVDRFCISVFAGNGFGTLYRQYQGKRYNECRIAYRTILEYMSKGDYANADIELSDIDDNPLSPRDKAQIEHDLQSSLIKLINNTKSIANCLDGKIEREEDNRSQIKEIIENIDKIRIALNKHRIMNLLDGGTRDDLQNFGKEINEILSRIILRGLRSIETFIDTDSFPEAEQGMENLSRVQRELAGYCISQSVNEKFQELRERINLLVSEILKKNDFTDVNNYSLNPPKDLLAKLKMAASHGSARFIQPYRSILGKVKQSFSLAINEVRNAPLHERCVKISSLNYALCFLPEDLQTYFNLQIGELSKLITEEEKAHKQQLETLLANMDDNEHSIIKLGSVAGWYKKQNLNDLFNKLHEQSLKKLYIYRTNVQTCLDKQDIQSAVSIVKIILKYEKSLGIYIPEVTEIYNSVHILIVKGFSYCCETLANISSAEQTQSIEKAFSDILAYLKFSDTFNKRDEEFFSENELRDVEYAFQSMSQYLYENFRKFQTALDDVNVNELYKVMLISKKWDKLLQTIRQCQLKHNLVKNLLEEIKRIISHTDMICELEKMVIQLKNQLNVELVSDETTKFEIKREEFFSKLMRTIEILREINLKFKDILSSTIYADKIEDLGKKIERISEQLLAKASRKELSSKDADDFRTYYNHLLSFEKYVRIPEIKSIRLVLDQSEEKILEKVRNLRKEIIESCSDAVKVCKMLIKMKFFAENLSMFDVNINTAIDKTLKVYKEEKGNLGMTSLTVELEKSDIGSRIISEHSCFSGEDCRIRREKMQKQDNLEYVLNELTGDDISKKILRSRYETFKEKYDNLVSNNLNFFNQNINKEPDVEVLVAEIKHLVGTITPTSKSVTWHRSFRDEIPDLLAHIFAVWTLQNTKHYNSMRGIEAAQSYLLMPHVGQVIAIFRLLGIGYENYKKIRGHQVPFTRKISDDLINNLVQVGTGEGKSVVMAITACVFALTGVDVNCSCYSEVLSARDKNDFASVFRALGIEERIEYGTFNRLCEQLLNEQCNVREKVRNMIATNQSTLIAADTSVRIRPKVLLIDEVDVFLSDKYYGGMYIPSVYLKDPSIKELLDSIWQNKSLKTLNSVKALPAYRTCANKYSNWIFLFDEAIKDMLAALKSFQSSTYIVQSDKIVYVEGESIVDNVVRGYDTIWAYYHEEERGNISQSSLNDSVGIILNCGTFSYAEMPHDFEYIAGVTGTLKTLAKAEKDILEKVYKVHKMTYMPSVFGSSNRTYNPGTDVRAVKDSEYFMEIRGEIDAVCHASRAILVFFESEEKLITFYNSSELSSIKHDVQIITETVSVKERELCIKRAATVGKVTLLTRTFGRGTDFICRNQQLLLNGGIHVLQTFFSEELSEEYQIMGRGARQGDRGSYRMILSDKDLEWVLGASWEEELPKIVGTTLYQTLNEARNLHYESKCGSKGVGIAQCKREHKDSKDFMAALSSGNIVAVKEFLKKQNQGANLIAASSRTVLLMDATGSMTNLLSAAKETVCTMFERASDILTLKGLSCNVFQMQFAVYRNYSSDVNKILEVSSWETKARNLRAFMSTIGPEGGMGEEAIEIGLWHATKESETEGGISQVILIGDAPANTQSDVTEKRTKLGEAYWEQTRFAVPTYYEDELQKLINKNIPVHSFYLTDYAKDNFQKIAISTNGRCEFLNIKSPQGARSLTDFVTEEVLRKAGGDQGDSIVELYRAKYVKSFTS
ncbi:unnamed protein product [Rotaria socialis]|uniref:SecA family profile domain-containing protein n=2 Tax=Rotaria socialis TaxID=392032 RepID=A0A818JM27_9BILA|nr:unnamed protein product [Rotaria socialis]CAF4223553.1 unnamed protein product [Rotaria socialis]